MKYVKSKLTGTIFEVIHKGENYVFGKEKGKPDTFGYTCHRRDEQLEEWTDEPRVGDKVRLKESASEWEHRKVFGGTYTLIHIHQAEDDERKFGVIAFEGDIPESVWYKSLEKVG